MRRNCLIAFVVVLSTILASLIGYVVWRENTESATPISTVPVRNETTGNTESKASAGEFATDSEITTFAVTESIEANTESTVVKQGSEAASETTVDAEKVTEPEESTKQTVPIKETTVPSTAPEETASTVTTTSSENNGLGENELPPM